MLPVGMLLTWGGWSISFWGWCLLRGYNVTLGQLMTPLHPYAGKWPPPLIPDSQIFPGGTKAGAPAGLTSPPIASKAALSNVVGTVLNQFKSHPPTPSGQPSTSQQLTGGV